MLPILILCCIPLNISKSKNDKLQFISFKSYLSSYNIRIKIYTGECVNVNIIIINIFFFFVLLLSQVMHLRIRFKYVEIFFFLIFIILYFNIYIFSKMYSIAESWNFYLKHGLITTLQLRVEFVIIYCNRFFYVKFK